MGEQLHVPAVDARMQECITDDQAAFFVQQGFLVVRNILVGEELAIIQREMMQLVNKGAQRVYGDPDFMYGKGEKTGQDVLRRVEYVIDKSDPMKALLGHPFILRSVEKLQGSSFIPTWDSMVLKMPDEGIVVPWHRDSAVPEGCTDSRPIFNVDFYLDDANLDSCLWVIPGSNQWDDNRAHERCIRPGFDTSDAIPVPMKAGDVIFHNITVVHGSPAGNGNPLRRTVYYEFRPGEIELEFGPHTREYLTHKQQVLVECLKRRRHAPYAAKEKPFEYRPTGDLVITNIEEPPTFRYPHKEFWRTA